MWIVYTLIGAFCAALTATFAKIGLKHIDPWIGTALQTIVVLIFTWSVVLMRGHFPDVLKITRKDGLFLVLSGVAMGAATLFFFQALKIGEASRVTPLDRVSLVFAIILAGFFLKEKVSAQVMVGAGVMLAGAITIAMAK